jgi:hypothetical protein
MVVDRIIRAGWLVLAVAVFVVWCLYPRVRRVYFYVDVSGLEHRYCPR